MAIFNTATDKENAVRRVRELSDQLALLETNANALDNQIAEAKANAGSAALDLENGKLSRKEYTTLASRVVDLEAERTQKLFAAGAVRQELAKAKEALFAATVGDRKRDAEKYAGLRAKAIEELIAGLQQTWRARQKLHEINAKAAQAFGASLTLRHGGTLLSPGEVDSAIAIELARICQAVPLPNATACPPLPGAKQFIIGNAAASKPLAELIADANAAMVRRVVEGYAPQPERKAEAKTAPAPQPSAEADEDDALLNPPAAQPGKTFRADQITMPRRELKV
jgi:hypothetical protein